MEMEWRQQPFPHARAHNRKLGQAGPGAIYIWDIDKTYLDTRFSQFRDLLKIALEWGVDKRALEGSAALLRALRGGRSGREHRPLYFVSASPPQMHPVISRKMLMDGVEWDGITYKDQKQLILKGRFSLLRKHLVFKLTGLCRLLEESPEGGELYLFGDDAEEDALTFSLFADLAEGRLRGLALWKRLESLGLSNKSARIFSEWSLPERRVPQIFIRMVRDPQGGSIGGFGPRLIGWSSASVLAQHLQQQGLISAEAAAKVPLSPGSLIHSSEA